MNRRNWIRLAGGGVITASLAPLVACSADLPAQALAAWRPPAADMELRRWAVSHALLAPHSHNLQSWLVDLREPDTVVLRMDLSRLLPETDPFSRQMTMSQGTFIELLCLAAQARAYRAHVELFPEGAFDARRPDGRPTARIRLIRDETAQPDALFAQVFHRRTNRSAYEARRPSPEALAAIRDSVRGYPVQLGFVDASDSAIEDHRRIAAEAWRTELSTARTLLESYKWLRVGPAEIAAHRDGISLNDPFVRALTALGLFDRSKASAPDSQEVQGQVKEFNAKLAATPAFFWMLTEDNHRATQVMAGRAYMRAQLAATAHGLSMHPLQQALQEYPEQERLHAEVHQLLRARGPGQTVQMWTRLGYASPVQAAPRRGLSAHIHSA